MSGETIYNVFVTSDIHFGHDKDFIYEPRGFDSVWDMNDAIVKNWNKVVHPEDVVYVLGDIMLGNNDKGIKLLRQLNGNLHIILGNHDTDMRRELYYQSWNVIDTSYADRFNYGKYHFYCSHYPTITACPNARNGLIERALINLCGHSHTPDRWADWDKGIIYHCELDAHHNTPVLIDDIINDLDMKWKEYKNDN